MKIKLLKPLSTDAGIYTGLPSDKVSWGEIVEGEYCSSNKGVYIKGSEFIRVGGLEEHFNPEGIYLWGSYEEVENDIELLEG